MLISSVISSKSLLKAPKVLHYPLSNSCAATPTGNHL